MLRTPFPGWQADASNSLFPAYLPDTAQRAIDAFAEWLRAKYKPIKNCNPLPKL